MCTYLFLIFFFLYASLKDRDTSEKSEIQNYVHVNLFTHKFSDMLEFSYFANLNELITATKLNVSSIKKQFILHTSKWVLSVGFFKLST